MLDPHTEAMLHAAAFGELVDKTALDRVLAESAEASARFAVLQQLAGDLRAMGTVDAPANLRATVMGDITARTMNTPGGNGAAFESRTGDTMHKKLMLGIAATVAAALGLYVAVGGSLPPEGAEGTIGAAKRYQGQQLSAADVKLGDHALQSFMQSPVFDKLRRSPEARAAFQTAVTSGNLAAMLGAASFQRLASEPAVMARAMDADLAAMALDADMQALMSQAQLTRATVDAEAMRMAISDVQLSRAYTDAELAMLVNDAAFAKLATDAELRQLLTDGNLKVALRDAELAAMLRDADFAALFSHAEFAAMLKNADFQALVRNAEFSKMSPDAFMSAFDTALRRPITQ